MIYSEFLEFRMQGKILAKFLTALIFGTPQKVFFGSFTKLWFRITILLKHLSVIIQEKEHTIDNFIIVAWWLIQQALFCFYFPQISQIFANFLFTGRPLGILR